MKKNKKQKKEIIGEGLNEKQKLFCFLYVTDKDCFGNVTKAYKKAYNCTLVVANKNAHRFMVNNGIIAYIDKLLLDFYNEHEADTQLSYLMKQNKDTVTKLGAIKEFNKLKNRITEKVDLTSKGEKILGINYIKPDGSNINPDN